MKTACSCLHCRATVKVPAKFLGTSIACPRCGNRFVASAPGTSQIPPPPPPRVPAQTPPAQPARTSAPVQPFPANIPAAVSVARPAIITAAPATGRPNWVYPAAAASALVAVTAAFLIGKAGSISQPVSAAPQTPVVQPRVPAARKAPAQKLKPPPEAAEPADSPDVAKTELPAAAPKELSAKELFEKVSGAVALIEMHGSNGQQLGLGSGFFVDAEGTLVTNAHVALADGTAFLLVKLPDGTTYFADEVSAFSREDDIAVVKVKAKNMPFVKLCEKPPQPGERAVAIGNPLGLKSTISEGLVSAVREDEAKKRSLIQTTAAISHGSSGGPLLNDRGEVMGVTTLNITGGQSLNFAVPAATVAALLAAKPERKKLAAVATSQPGLLPDGQLPVAYVIDKKILTGLKRVAVVVEDLHHEVQVAGLLRDNLQTNAELKLRTLGVPVRDIADADKDERKAYIYVSVGSVGPMPSGQIAYSVRVELKELVALTSPVDKRIVTTTAATWGCPGITGFAPRSEIAEVVKNCVQDMVNKFANDYLAANPK